MFNFNAETFVIVYPRAAGGRFLQKVIGLDNQIVVMNSITPVNNTSDIVFISGAEYFDNCKFELEDGHNDAQSSVLRGRDTVCRPLHLSSYAPEEMPRAKRYVFCIHQTEIPLATAFLKQCKNLKIILIGTSTQSSLDQITIRRQFFCQRDNIVLDDYNIHYDELETIRMFNQAVKLKVGVWPIFTIETEDYWDPEKAIPLLTKFFKEQKITCKNWEELYHIWHTNAIRIPSDAIKDNS